MVFDFNDILTHRNGIVVMIFTFGTAIVLVSIILGTIKSILVARAKEATKRELAAYVAEGTLDADKAIAMLESDKPVWEREGGSRRKA